MSRYNVLILCAVLLTCDLCAQPLSPEKQLSQFNLDKRQDENAPSSILQILQSKDGYLWMATLKGIGRFDGIKLHLYDKFSHPVLKANGFKSMIEDAKGNFWIGSIGGGLFLKKKNRFYQIPVPFGASSNNIERVSTDSRGNLWLSTLKGVILYKDSTFYHIKPDDVSSSTDFPIYDVVEDARGQIIVGSAKGLFKIDNQKLVPYLPELYGEVSDLHLDASGNLWATFYSNGIFTIANDTARRVSELARLRHPNTIFEDRQGQIWIGSEAGVVRWNNGEVSFLDSDKGLSHNNVTAILEDHEGSVWLGTYYGGINRLRDGTFTNYSVVNGLPHQTVHAVCESRDSAMYIATESDVAVIQNGNIKILSSRYPALRNLRVRDIYEATNGALWIATYDGIFRIHQGKLTSFNESNEVSNSQTRVIMEDSRGRLWIGARQGLFTFENEKWVAHGPQNGLQSDFVMSILERNDGTILVGTTGGLYQMRDGKFEPLKVSGREINMTLFRMFEDKDNRLWIGTSSGLLTLHEGKLTSYGDYAQLLSGNIYQVLEDDHEMIWLTSDRGVMKVDKNILVNRTVSDTTKKGITLFDKSSGMRTNEITPTSKAFKDRTGRLWFATLDGVSMVDPSNIVINKTAPPIAIEKVLVAGEEKDPALPINVSAGMKNIEIHYSGLSFMIPKKVRFKYKLEGYDTDWQDVGERRVAYYTSLPAGDYIFKVAASNNDGIWNFKTEALTIIVDKAFWQTPWFIILAGLVISGAVMGAIHFRTRRIHQLNQVLEDKIRERTQEVTLQKEEIESQRDYIEAKNTELEKANDLIAKQYADLKEINENLEHKVRERTVELRKAYDDVITLNRELDDFVYKSAHDIKGPLARLQGLCNLALLEAQEPRIRQYLGKLQHESELANRVIQKLSHAHAIKNYSPASTKVHVSALLANVIKELATFHYQETKDTIHFDLKISDHLDLVTDSNLLREILYHLIENCIVFRNEKDPVIKIRTSVLDNNLRISIRDNGIGIDSKISAEVFNMFVKGSEKSQGLGLGLYIVRKGIEKLNGQVNLVSANPGNTEFEILLPLTLTGTAAHYARAHA